MSFKKSWSVDEITQQIHHAARECRSPYNDGYTGWYVKQDLYQIKSILDTALKSCPSFGDTEEQWLTEQEQKRIIKHLKS
jgi:hypothetical protein